MTVVDSTPEIDELLSADAPGAQTVSNDAPGALGPWTSIGTISNGWSGASYAVPSASPVTVNPGEEMRIRILSKERMSKMKID